MDARELRIGNFVSDLDASDRFFAAVKKLDYSRCYYGQFHSAYSDLKPIPITEEWLKRFGFEHSPEAMNYNLWVGNGIVGEFIDGLFHIQASGLPQCNQVHQLQNLYFALTGQELEIK